jgi:hypothetical protein
MLVLMSLPLLLLFCSLALLPAGAQQHVPSAVAHLMDSSSPIYDMYASCEGCEAAAQEAYVAQRAYDVSREGSSFCMFLHACCGCPSVAELCFFARSYQGVSVFVKLLR